MKVKKEEKIKYEVFSVRLHEATKKKLIEGRKNFGKSWNLYMLELLTKKI